MDRQATNRNDARKAKREREGLWDWNLVSNRIHFSPGWIALVGSQDHEVGNTPDDWFRRVHPDDRDLLLRDIETLKTDGACEFDLRYRLRHKDGTYRWMSSRGMVVRNERDAPIRLTGAQSDVTVETVTDALTGLPNRLLLLDRLAQSIARAQRHDGFQFALILLDLGRPAGTGPGVRSGDPVLNAAARRLETCLRLPELLAEQRQNDLVARVEGDLLAVLLDGLTDLTHAKAVGDRILGEMLGPFTLSGRDVRLSPAIGIAVSATGYAHPDEALRDAQTALHRARVLGGSHCELFDADVLKSEQSDLQLEGDFELALQRGEFELVYQPIVSIASHEVTGFEALVRWRHPVLGPIAPLDFVPIAERTGFIVPLGRWILREACAQLKAWQTSLPARDTLWVSVNVSGVQVRDADVTEHVAEALRDSGLPARSLVLELTEGIAMDNPGAATTVLMRLRSLGVRISIDDFGTGYSSLAYLRQFPVDALKIDQSFVRAMDTDKDTVAIVASMVAMAKQLGLHVVAEGIENQDQLDLLRSLHCESAQGFLFARPLEAAAVEGFLQAAAQDQESQPEAGAADSASTPPAQGLRPWYHLEVPGPGRRLAVAGAVLGVLASAGVAALFQARRGAAPSASSGIVERQETQPDARPGVPARAETVASPATGAAPIETPPDASAVSVAGRLQASGTAQPTRRTFAVMHMHRFGSCRGRLRVSGAGLAYMPDEKGSEDAMTLKPGTFEHSVDGNTVTIRSDDRTYRFVVVAAASKDHTAAGVAKALAGIDGGSVRENASRQ